MSTCAFYYPRNIEVDLAALPTWLYSEIISLHGHITRPTDTNPPVLTCLGNGEPMYIRRQETGRFFAVHFPGGNPDGHRHGIGRMSVQPLDIRAVFRIQDRHVQGVAQGSSTPAQAVDRGYCGVCKYELRFQRGA